MPAEPAAQVRYHFGDDARWADPDFDDSAWAVAQRGRWPVPPYDSNGFIWVRVRVPARGVAAGPLALCVRGKNVLIADEIFVNGVLVGRQGSLPPRTEMSLFARDEVFSLPAGLAAPGSAAVLAFRAWYPAGVRSLAREGGAAFTIDASQMQHLALQADHDASLIAEGPNLALNGIILILGLGLLFFWRWAGGRDLLVCSWMLMATSLMSLWNVASPLGLVSISGRAFFVVDAGLQALSMAATVELVWTVHGLRALGVKRLYHASWAIGTAAYLILMLAVKPSPIILWSGLTMMPAIASFDCIQIAVNLWALMVKRANRLIAVAMIVIAVADLLQNFGYLRGAKFGPFQETYFGLSLFLCEFALFVMLGQRAWKAWRARDELRVEFDAAREVQQQLVAPAVDVPGFKIESVYAPAKHVGGDFFRVLPEADGGVLVVVGDVSGKGLKAAMTVSAIVGALRTMPALPPSRILGALNRGLAGQMQGGFVTCCAARIGQDGTVSIANAGHLSPYRNGVEVPAAAGLPLGIDPAAEYEESQFQLQPAEPLTFVSDGIVEARNAAGELFGFDRTLQISASGAEAIARAAMDFGQDDDITVLTLTRLEESVPSNGPLSAPTLVPA
ncbi:MAG: serine/threonine-protein phosphatase [Acidobacteriota bacterium]|nr:serine/threonine-protein phosphatase [Acidobacteriota bacterium]